MEDTLVKGILSLGSDAPLRSENLRRLLGALTGTELRQVRRHLAGLDLRKDIVPNLPTELRALIVSYLDGEDYCRALLVSRAWYTALQDLHVLQSLAHKLFPGLFECFQLRDLAGIEQDFGPLLLRKIRHNRLRIRGSFRKARYITRHDLSFDPAMPVFGLQHVIPPNGMMTWADLLGPEADREFIRIPLGYAPYSHGRLVWQPHGVSRNASFIFVDDLRTQQRKKYCVPDLNPVITGTSLDVKAVSDTLVVAAAGRQLSVPLLPLPASPSSSAYLDAVTSGVPSGFPSDQSRFLTLLCRYAWHLSKDEKYQVTLPSVPKIIKVHGKRIFIAAGSLDGISIWTFGESFVALDTSRVILDISQKAEEHGNSFQSLYTNGNGWTNHMGFLFHPVLENVMFLVIQHPYGISVYEYTDMSYSRSFHAGLDQFPTNVWKQVHSQITWEKNSLSCTPMNSYGQFALLARTTANCGHGTLACMCDKTLVCNWHVCCFDAIQTKFSAERYVLASVTAAPSPTMRISNYKAPDCSFWNRMCISSIVGVFGDTFGGVPLTRSFPLLAMCEQSDIRPKAGPCRIHGVLDQPRAGVVEESGHSSEEPFDELEFMGNTRRWLSLAAGIYKDAAVQFGLDYISDPSLHGQSIGIYQDDDFIVWHTSTGYYFWKF